MLLISFSFLMRESGSAKVTFIPHRVPMTRGILATCYAPLHDDRVGKQAVWEMYREFYRDEPFVRVMKEPPQTKHTLVTNFCLVYPTVDEQTGKLIVISCLDNLVKGAAGQAVQNMNLMCGLPENMALESLALYP